MNMIVPIDLLPPILNDLLRQGSVDKPLRPWLGAFAAENNGRVVVMSVAEGGPAAKAGMRPGDVISDVQDGEVEDLFDFYRKLWATGPAGSDVPLRIVRDGREAWVRVRSSDRSSFLRKPHLQYRFPCGGTNYRGQRTAHSSRRSAATIRRWPCSIARPLTQLTTSPRRKPV